MMEHAVIIVGAGPTGLMLAGELKLAQVDVAIVERRTRQDVVGSRARGLHSRTIEVLDQRGLAERFLAAGKVAQVAGFAGVPLDIGDFPTRHHYGLALGQQQIERLLADWVAELDVPFYRGQEVTGFTQDDGGVEVELAEGPPSRARYLVACDGGRSRLRKEAGIAFPGTEPTISNLIAEVELDEEPPWGIRRDRVGIHSLSKLGDRATVGVLVTEQQVGHTEEPTLEELSEALIAVYGSDFGAHGARSISRFTDMTRQAAAYRDRRLLLAGDSAHVHPPDGGHGLQIGVQDAVNLGWKLAQVVNGTSPDSLLDTYHAERHPVAARVLRSTLASVALRHSDERTEALRATVAELVSMDEPRRRLAAMMSGLDVRYEVVPPDVETHPLLGRRMPDLDLAAGVSSLSVFTLLHDARPLLLNLGAPGAFDITAGAARVRVVDATYEGPWELPALGRVDAPEAVLVRPDGYVAWVGDGSRRGLADALTKWFGAPSTTATGGARC